ncbi:HK97 family phage prohead protease [Ponticaulis sp.]|uniref:HK97 family phage prohead protease n=1 Tax=Ponticaulis sp. TaxID=2020902 RepID=UPI0025D10B33|nr:HK97 family phage prohead protease [Ponticaulis sp.]|tara:strand:+ start:18181 stop:18579 length:399 start_codon:yes stop_codon:yes gene_type:complete
MLIEGLASVFLETDQMGDRVRPGAFAASLADGARIPMLWRHRSGALAGVWSHLRETGRGLEVRGLVDDAKPYGKLALQSIRSGLDGLSIGFRPKRWRYRPDGGRDLIEVDLVEISLTANPMAQSARFRAVGT